MFLFMLCFLLLSLSLKGQSSISEPPLDSATMANLPEILDSLAQQGQNDSALVLLRKSVPYKLEQEDPRAISELSLMAYFFFMMSQKDSFEIYADRVLTEVQEQSDQASVYYSKALFVLATCHLQEERKARADSLLAWAQEIYEASPIEDEIKHKTTGLELYRVRGVSSGMDQDYETSMIYLQKAYQLLVDPLEGSLIGLRAKLEQNIGYVYAQIGQMDQARYFLQQSVESLQRFLLPTHYQFAEVYTNLSQIEMMMGRFEDALQTQKRSLAIRQQYKEGLIFYYQSYDFHNIGDIYLNMGKPEQAIPMFRQSITVQKDFFEGQIPVAVALDYIKMIACFAQMGDLDSSEIYLAKGIQLLAPNWEQGSDTGYPPASEVLDSGMYLQLMQMAASMYQGQTTLALQTLKAYEKVDEIFAHWLKQFGSYETRLRMIAPVMSTYEQAIALSLQRFEDTGDQMYQEKAFQFAERSHSLLLALNVQESDARNIPGIPQALRDRLQTIETLTSQLQQTLNSPEVDASTISNLLTARQQQDSLIQVLETDYPDYYALKYEVGGKSVEEIRACLLTDASNALLSYYVGSSTLYAFVLTTDTLAVETIPIGQDSLGNYIDTLLAHQNTPSALFQDHALQLYQSLLAPFASIIEGKNLLIIRDGPLYSLPFELLLTGKAVGGKPIPYLIRDHAISYGYSAHLLARACEAAQKKGNGKLAAFVPGKFAQTRPTPTPAIDKLAQHLTQQFGADLWLHDQATLQAFQTYAPGYTLLFLGTHGVLNTDQSGDSFLAFAAQESDSMHIPDLRVSEIFSMQIDAELAMLPVCNSGQGQTFQGEGEMSLGRAFRYAGCPSLVLGLWEIDQIWTADLMEQFIAGLAKGLSKAEAMQAAKLYLLDQPEDKRQQLHPSSPLAWAGVIVVGDPRPVHISKPWGGFWFGLGGLLILLLIGAMILYRRRAFS